MHTRIARRLLLFPVVLLAIYTATFALAVVAPGDPLSNADGKMAPETVRELRARFGLDQPWHVQYWRYLRHTASAAVDGELDLGPSMVYRDRPVAEILGLTPASWPTGALKVSLTLGLLALALAVGVGMELGILAARRQHSWADHLTMGVSVAGLSLPPFVVGAGLILLFAILIPIFPVGGWGSLRQMVLPAVTLSLPFAAYIARLMRAGMLDVLGADYVRTARAKGLGERAVIYKHAFKLAFLPVLSYLGPATAAVLTGSFVVESLYAVPGIGRYFVESVISRDQYMILGTVLVYSVLLVGLNLVVDLLYVAVDPRIREDAV